jgi:selenocysteine lyase/cysteine desulfurase
VVGGIRLGLALQLKASVGSEVVAAADHELTRRLYGGLAAHPRVTVMGPPLPPDGDTSRRLPIVSFLVRAPEVNGHSRFLHYNFVSTVLNDLFGIQSTHHPAQAALIGFHPQLHWSDRRLC